MCARHLQIRRDRNHWRLSGPVRKVLHNQYSLPRVPGSFKKAVVEEQKIMGKKPIILECTFYQGTISTYHMSRFIECEKHRHFRFPEKVNMQPIKLDPEVYCCIDCTLRRC